MTGQLITELDGRWRAMFAALAAGDDVPPSQRLRAEGLMEAAVLQQLATEEEITLAMAACYLAAFGRALDEDFGADWQAFFPFPQIPAMGKRAPVFPSTPE